MGQRIKRAVLTATMLSLVGVALPATARAEVPRASTALTAAQVKALSLNADQSVIVVFKNQLSALPANVTFGADRQAALKGIQSPVVGELRQLHAAHLHSYDLINAVSATVSEAEESRLAANPAVAEVVANATTHLEFNTPTAAVSAAASSDRAHPAVRGTGNSANAVCQEEGSPAVELDPQALETIRANNNEPHSAPTAASLGITGAGVKVAFVAEGIDVDQPNFQRANGSHVVVDQADFTGEGDAGTVSGGEASLDASSIAAQGNVEYTAKLANGQECNFVIEGAAPGADLVSLKAFPSNHDATSTSLLEAIDYAVSTEHVNVLNESFGYNPLPDTMNDLIRQANEAAVAAGTVVDVSSGDAGPTSTQGSPSTDPAVIAAGASTTYRVYAQEDIENYSSIGAKGWENDNLSGLSGGGSSYNLKGPNLLAPGDLNWDTCNPAPGEFGACISGGTSEAAPLTSATAALVIQAYRKTHSGATPSPALVEQIILSTTTDLGLPANQQGSGLLDSYKAVLEAESIGLPATKATGSSVSLSTSDITATAPVKTSVSQPVTLTNSGGTTETIGLAGRTLSAPTRLVASSFSESGSSWSKVVTFTVPAGVSYLDTHLATDPNPPSGYVDIQLVDPSGRFAEAALTQGYSDTANAGVRLPEAGTWTAYLEYGQGSSSGAAPTEFVATAQTWIRYGTVTPNKVTIGPGSSATVQATFVTPAAAGDQSGAIAVTSGPNVDTSIPVELRALVPFSNGVGHFRTSLGGGNGRGGAPASEAYFAFDVPTGEPELNVDTAFKDGDFDNYSVFVVSPNGETLGHASNQLLTGGTVTDPQTSQTEAGAVSHVLSPVAGQWTLIVALTNPASGPLVSSPLTGTIDFDAVSPAVSGLPHSTKTVIPVGQSRTASITITNSSSVPQAYFLDARLNQAVTVTLKSLTKSTNIRLPLGVSAQIPQWIVPTDTTSVTATASATAPVTFDMSPYLGNFEGELNGDPQVGATSNGDEATSSISADVLTPGDWDVDPALTGTFGSKPTPGGTVNLSMSATTLAFDGAVHTTYGDLWSGDNSVTPVIVSPGQTITLYATIAPTVAGAVNGTLFVDTATDISPFGQPIPVGDQVAAIPYAYTAK
jgi:Subtilase family